MARLGDKARDLCRRIMGSVGMVGVLVLVGCGTPAGRDDPAATTYEPTPPRIQDVGEQLVGPILYTIDARSQDVWMYFDFARGAVVGLQNPQTEAWDLAFQRYVIRSNGGQTNPAAQGALLSLDERPFAAIDRVPENAIFVADVRPANRPFSYNPVIEKMVRLQLSFQRPGAETIELHRADAGWEIRQDAYCELLLYQS